MAQPPRGRPPAFRQQVDQLIKPSLALRGRVPGVARSGAVGSQVHSLSDFPALSEVITGLALSALERLRTVTPRFVNLANAGCANRSDQAINGNDLSLREKISSGGCCDLAQAALLRCGIDSNSMPWQAHPPSAGRATSRERQSNLRCGRCALTLPQPAAQPPYVFARIVRHTNETSI